MAASAMTVMLFPSCDKDDDGGSAGGFDVHVPSFVKGTTPIRVDLGVSCDKAPTVTFATEGDALGVVSPVENPEFDTDYVYAGEPIDASFVNGPRYGFVLVYPPYTGQPCRYLHGQLYAKRCGQDRHEPQGIEGIRCLERRVLSGGCW